MLPRTAIALILLMNASDASDAAAQSVFFCSMNTFGSADTKVTTFTNEKFKMRVDNKGVKFGSGDHLFSNSSANFKKYVNDGLWIAETPVSKYSFSNETNFLFSAFVLSENKVLFGTASCSKF